MSKIVMLVRDDSLAALKALREATGAPYAELRDRVRSGRPAAEFVLLLNDHEEIAARLLTLVRELLGQGVHFSIFEIEAEEQFDLVPDLHACAMTPDVLENALKQHERETARQKRLDSE